MTLTIPSWRKLAWIGACLTVLLVSRVPAIVCPFEINLDEGQLAAQAMRYGQDLTPWRSVEGETNGPLDSWFLLAAHDLGMPYDYPSLHLTAALCLAAILLATYAAARWLVGDPAALVGLAAGAWWLAWAPAPDFVHYSSELVPALLLSLGLAAVARARRAPTGPDWRLGLIAGGLLGLAPWGKLQAGPIALVLGAWALADGLAGSAGSASTRRRYAGALLAGALLPVLVLGGWVAAAGAGEEFWRIYLVNGGNNGRFQTWSAEARNLGGILTWYDNYPWIWTSALLVAGALGMRRRGRGAPVRRRVGVLAVLWLAAGLAVALRPVAQRPHYALLFLAPLILLVVLAAEVILAAGNARRGRSWLLIALALVPLPVAHCFRYHYDRVAEALWSARSSHLFDGETYLAAAVRHFVPRPRSLAVWGWKPSLYVDLGLPPATRNAVNAFLTDGNPNQEFLRAAFLRDLAAARPEVIVDVEDMVHLGRRRTPPAIFPAFAQYLELHYAVAGTAEITRTAEDRMVIVIYDRLP
jgi:hypothetical protein